jgi:programmed cell death 6-interacting protein
MEHQLRNEYALDMTTKFVAAQAENQFIDEEALSNAALIELFQPMDNQIKEQTDAQDTVARNLERCAQQIGTCKGSSDASDIQRSQKINILTSASSAYQELTKHLQEGTKFYNDLTDRLVKTQSQINDFVTSRKLEADELCKSMGNVSISQSPSVTSTSSAAPPARPPPPSFKENQQPPVAAPRTSVSSTTPSQPNLPNYQNVQPQATYPPQQQFQNMATAPVYRPPQPGAAAPPQQQPGGYPMPYPVYQPGVVPGYPMQGGYPMQQFPPQGYPQQQHPGMNPYQGYPQQGFPPNQQPPPQ